MFGMDRQDSQPTNLALCSLLCYILPAACLPGNRNWIWIMTQWCTFYNYLHKPQKNIKYIAITSQIFRLNARRLRSSFNINVRSRSTPISKKSSNLTTMRQNLRRRSLSFASLAPEPLKPLSGTYLSLCLPGWSCGGQECPDGSCGPTGS
jgi:hypothetical protein